MPVTDFKTLRCHSPRRMACGGEDHPSRSERAPLQEPPAAAPRNRPPPADDRASGFCACPTPAFRGHTCVFTPELLEPACKRPNPADHSLNALAIRLARARVGAYGFVRIANLGATAYRLRRVCRGKTSGGRDALLPRATHPTTSSRARARSRARCCVRIVRNVYRFLWQFTAAGRVQPTSFREPPGAAITCGQRVPDVSCCDVSDSPKGPKGRFTMRVKSTLERLFSVRTASAHCDIPCGIYDPISAKIAAQTVQKMVLRIEALQDTGDVSYANTLGRYVTVKEEHAELCKHELSHPVGRLRLARHRRQRHRSQVQRRAQACGPVQADGQHGQCDGAGRRR